MNLIAVEPENFESEAKAQGINLPIEQTQSWATYENTISGRSDWGTYKLVEGEETRAFIRFYDYETHGYHFLRANHAPVWVQKPTPEEESAGLDAIAAYVHEHDKKQVFCRLAVDADLPQTRPVLSTIPYDATVIIDLSGSDDDILARFKSRGRRDVRKALRESPAKYADETEAAAKDFSEYYDVIVETGNRDDFVPAPKSDYEDMIRILGPEHCRVYAGRVDGKVVTWSIVTMNGTRAVRFYGASRTATMRAHVTDALVYFECCDLAHNKGMTDYDMMGIGSDFAPTLKGLNEFKCKFSKETVRVAPDRDLPIHKIEYSMLQKAKSLRHQNK